MSLGPTSRFFAHHPVLTIKDTRSLCDCRSMQCDIGRRTPDSGPSRITRMPVMLRPGLYSPQTMVTKCSDQFRLPVMFLQTRIHFAIQICELIHFRLEYSDKQSHVESYFGSRVPILSRDGCICDSVREPRRFPTTSRLALASEIDSVLSDTVFELVRLIVLTSSKSRAKTPLALCQKCPLCLLPAARSPARGPARIFSRMFLAHTHSPYPVARCGLATHSLRAFSSSWISTRNHTRTAIRKHLRPSAISERGGAGLIRRRWDEIAHMASLCQRKRQFPRWKVLHRSSSQLRGSECSAAMQRK